MNLKNLNENDPLKRVVEKQTNQQEFSPMNPPDAYLPPNTDAIPYEEMPSFLRCLMDDHKQINEKLALFEGVLSQLQKKGLAADPNIDKGLREFFTFLDEKIVLHNLKEEKILFPVLQERLLAKGEHSRGANPETAVDMLEDDHIKTMQLAAVAFNLLGLAVRLPDVTSRAITLDAALEQGKALIELLRLHIFREENTVFPMAVKLITPDEFKKMEELPFNY